MLSKDLLSGLEIGESSLHLTDPRGFDANKIGGVTLEANGKSKSWERITQAGGVPRRARRVVDARRGL